jgi:hypothetical protein
VQDRQVPSPLRRFNRLVDQQFAADHGTPWSGEGFAQGASKFAEGIGLV